MARLLSYVYRDCEGKYTYRSIGEIPIICPVLKNNGDEAQKVPSPIFYEQMDTGTYSYSNTPLSL